MISKSRDAPDWAGKSKQTEPTETIPRDVGEFVGTVAHEVQSIAWLARGLCEADASKESAALIKRASRVLDEGVHGASKTLLDQPLGKILEKKNVHVAEDEAVSSVGNLATVIESRLNILLEFARAVQKRNILGTPEGLQFFDKHRAAHYPRIVPLLEPADGLSQLAEENEQLKRDNALIQKEADELAHDLGQREDDAEFNASFPSRQPRRHVLGLHLWVALPLVLLVGLVMTAGISWSSARYYYGVAEHEHTLREQAEAFKQSLSDYHATQAEIISSLVSEKKYQHALILLDGIEGDGEQYPTTHVTVIMAIVKDVYPELDVTIIRDALETVEANHLAEEESP